jgi:small subunit ribosomal protein S16
VSVKIRLTRAGRKKQPFYRIVVMDSRHRRDGAYIEHLGVYHPNNQPAHVEIKEDKALAWLLEGAIPSDTVRSLFSRCGLMLRFDLKKRGSTHEKIEEAVAKWAEQAKLREARNASKPRRKKKASEAQTDNATTGS